MCSQHNPKKHYSMLSRLISSEEAFTCIFSSQQWAVHACMVSIDYANTYVHALVLYRLIGSQSETADYWEIL